MIFLLNCAIVAATVTIHYEFLQQLSTLLPKMLLRHRFRIVLGVLGALIAHAVEIGIFAVAYYFLNRSEGGGELRGNFDGSLLDSVYFSSTVYTTLGFGDIEPVGSLRYLTGVESLTGFVLITWTASFLYVEMQRFWSRD